MPTNDNATPPSYTLKGFVGFGAFANNNPSITAQLGELSLVSQTYAQDRQLFGGATPGSNPSSVDLTVFSSKDANAALQPVPVDYAAQLIGIAGWMYNQAIGGIFTADPAIFLQAFTAEYGTAVTDIVVGQMTSNGSSWLPASLEFFFTSPAPSAPTLTANTRIKLWFADDAFQTEYDEYTINFIPPLTPLDTFFESAAEISTILNQRTSSQLLQQIQVSRGEARETFLVGEQYNWIDPVTSGNFLPTTWTCLIYGAAGNNVDAIKAALAAYILANSTHSESEWQQIFPDIFTATEYILTPLWNQIAIPNQTLDVGAVYSPTVNTVQALNIAEATAKGSGYTNEFITNILNVVPVPFKSMAVLAVGGPQNRGGVSEFAKQWPDYINVATSSIDFARMTQDTQGFVTLLAQLLMVAETATASSDLPVGITRMSRSDDDGNSVDYIVGNYDSVDYLVVTKEWLVNKYGTSTNTTGSLGISYNGIFVNGAYQLLNSSNTMSLQFQPANAQAPVTWELLDTTATGGTIDQTTGLFVGTFPTVGLYTVTLKLTDQTAHSAQRTFTFNYQQPDQGSGGTTPPLTLTNIVAPTAQVGTAYVGSIDIGGGSSPYALDGDQTVPAGMAASVQGNKVVLGGTPTVAGTGSFNIKVKDSSGAGGGQALSVSTQFTIQIDPSATPEPITFDTTNMPSGGSVNSEYSGTISLAGGTPPYSLGALTLPPGLTAELSDSTITVAGTPTGQAAGDQTLSIVVNDSASGTVTVTDTLTFIE